jgi:hypothetical protein
MAIATTAARLRRSDFAIRVRARRTLGSGLTMIPRLSLCDLMLPMVSNGVFLFLMKRTVTFDNSYVKQISEAP